MNKIIIKQEEYSDREFLVFKIQGNQSYISEHLQKLSFINWSEKRQCLYMERRPNDIGIIFRHLKGSGAYLDYRNLKKQKKNKEQTNNLFNRRANSNAKRSLPELNELTQRYIQDFERWMKQKRYSRNTINTYLNLLSIFFRYYNDMAVEDIGIPEIERFNFEFIIENNYSFTFQNQTISAIKLFYLKMLKIKVEFELLERPRRSRPLPKVISREHVQQLLKSIKNMKHKTALTTIYSLGLRRSELINLKLSDIYLERDVVIIRNAKGQKDRVLPLSGKLKDLIIKYYNIYKPNVFLIEGFEEGGKYSESSLHNIFKNNLNKIIKGNNFTLHCLRHSYATHLHDAGVDIRNIQELLGHKSSITTEIYTHVSMRNLKNIINPIENFDL